jgi:hypothetical protein
VTQLQIDYLAKPRLRLTRLNHDPGYWLQLILLELRARGRGGFFEVCEHFWPDVRWMYVTLANTGLWQCWRCTPARSTERWGVCERCGLLLLRDLLSWVHAHLRPRLGYGAMDLWVRFELCDECLETELAGM